MRVKVLFFVLLITSFVNADYEYRVENSNFTISQGSQDPHNDDTYIYNYDRLRLRFDYMYESYFATLIADGVNYYGRSYVDSLEFEYIKLQKADTPLNTQSEHYNYGSGSTYAKLHRLYGGYEDSKNRVVIGLQNITMGVGRIWNPTNLFNPRNVYALEPDETFGVLGIAYTRYMSDTSQVTVVASQKADESFKYALQYKSYLEFADFGFDIVSTDKTTMFGYEIEGNLGESGVEVRSEGAYIKSELQKDISTTQDMEYFQGILGADYGFVNGVTLISELLYSSKSFSYEEILLNYDSEIAPNLLYSNFYGALSLSYGFNIYLDASLTYIESFREKNSRFISPAFKYTLNDFNSLSLGAMIYNGGEESEFGMYENSYYLQWVLSF